MKVLYVLSGTTIFGGATKSFDNMLSYLLEKEVDVLVITPDSSGFYLDLKYRNIKVRNIPYTFATYPSKKGFYNKILYPLRLARKILYNMLGYIKLLNIAKSFKPNIIHSNSSVLDIGIRVANRLNLPHIFHIREYGDLDFSMDMRRMDKLLNKSHTISITKDIKNYKHRNNPKLDRIIYNGIFSEKKIRYTKTKLPYLLFAGRIEKTKGIEDLIDAYIAYTKKVTVPLDLWIAGTIEEHSKCLVSNLTSKLKIAGINENVKWLGSRSDINDLMYNATATIIPSYQEGFGRVMPEAMANGCICIARNTGGLKEQFDNGLKVTSKEIGLRFSTTEELCKQIELIHSFSEIEKERMIIASQKTITELYTNEKSGKTIFDFYKEIINHT